MASRGAASGSGRSARRAGTSRPCAAPVTSTFVPSSRQPASGPSPSVAVVVIPVRSLPASASVYAMHSVTSPRAIAGSSAARCSSDPNARIGAPPSVSAVSMSGASNAGGLERERGAVRSRPLPQPPYSAGNVNARYPRAPASRWRSRSNSSSRPVRSSGSRMVLRASRASSPHAGSRGPRCGTPRRRARSSCARGSVRLVSPRRTRRLS